MSEFLYASLWKYALLSLAVFASPVGNKHPNTDPPAIITLFQSRYLNWFSVNNSKFIKNSFLSTITDSSVFLF